MKRVDRFLAALVAGVVLLIIVAFALARFGPQPDYRAGSGPADVAHNYLFALQQADYERAYSYIAPDIVNYPASLTVFRRQVLDNSYLFNLSGAASLTVGEADIHGDIATVPVRQQVYYEGGFLSGGGSYDDDFTMILERSGPDAPWLLVKASQFWEYCWGESDYSC